MDRVTNPQKIGNADTSGLKAAIALAANGEVGIGKRNSEFFNDPLAIWVETRIGLKNVETKPERANPIALEEAAALLSDESGADLDTCTKMHFVKR